MPTYDYECSKCGNRFELFQKMTDEPRQPCPQCGGRSERLIGTGSGIIFKGSGFYATDYKGKSNSRDNTSCPETKSDSCSTCPKNLEGKG